MLIISYFLYLKLKKHYNGYKKWINMYLKQEKINLSLKYIKYLLYKNDIKEIFIYLNDLENDIKKEILLFLKKIPNLTLQNKINNFENN